MEAVVGSLKKDDGGDGDAMDKVQAISNFDYKRVARRWPRAKEVDLNLVQYEGNGSRK